MGKVNRIAKLAVATAVAALASGCGEDHPLDTFSPAGEGADQIRDLSWPVFIVAFIVLVGVFGAVIFMWWRFRVPGPSDDELADGPYADDEFPNQLHGNTRLEIGWTIAPAVLLAIIAVFTLVTLLKLDDVDAEPNTVEIVVVGQQWWWEYQYHLDGDTETPPDFVTANEAVIPIDTDVRLWITSRDVIHSFWIPRLNGKRDAVPGRVHPWVIQADQPGRFAGTCTEFCGLSHAYMRMYVLALDEAGFDSWVDAQLQEQAVPAEGDEGFEGYELFVANCARCHVVNGVTERDRDGDPETPPEPDDMAMYGNLGEYENLPDLSQGMYTEDGNLLAGAAPNLTHFASRTSYAGSFFELYDGLDDILADDPDAYLRLGGGDVAPLNRDQLEAWLRNAPAEKPNRPENLQGMPNLNLTEDQIDALVEYLLTLD